MRPVNIWTLWMTTKTVGKVFEERLRAMYDIDDDDVEGQPS